MEEFLDNEQKKDAAKQNRNRDGGGETEKRPELHPEYKRYFYKEHPTDKVYWVTRVPHCYGNNEFSFDKKRVYDLFSEYPYALTKEERQIFDKENPFWADFFSYRNTESRINKMRGKENGGRNQEEQ